MTMPSEIKSSRALILIAAIIGIIIYPATASAQRAGPGFLFQSPSTTITLRGGFALSDADSEIFDFTTSELTLGRRDFHGPAVDLDIGFRLLPRLDLVLNLGYAGARSNSEFREWVDQDDLPIEQTTRFQRVPLTASLRLYPTPRGRQIGRLAWVPARVAPYIGAGTGFLWYRFSQEGDFVDFNSLEIFPDYFESSGWTPILQALAGTEISIAPRWAMIAEARYTYASARLRSDFKSFGPIDLSGLTTSIGIQLRVN